VHAVGSACEASGRRDQAKFGMALDLMRLADVVDGDQDDVGRLGPTKTAFQRSLGVPGPVGGLMRRRAARLRSQ